MTANLLWNIWKHRNEANFNSNFQPSIRLAAKSVEEWLEFQNANNAADQLRVANVERQTDRNDGHVCNSQVTNIFRDVAFDKRTNKTGIGVVVWTEERKLKATWAIPMEQTSDAAVAEALAIRAALQLAIELKLAVINIL